MNRIAKDSIYELAPYPERLPAERRGITPSKGPRGPNKASGDISWSISITWVRPLALAVHIAWYLAFDRAGHEQHVIR